MKNILLITLLILASAIVWADAMPDFRLQDATGKNVTLSELLDGNPLIIDFWADYCKPCKQSMPLLSDLAERYEDITVVMISIDKPKDQQRSKNYLKQNNFKFVTLFDPDMTLAKKLNVSIPPHTFILDGKGEIVYSHKGFDPSVMEEYEAQIIALLKLGEKPDTQLEEKPGAQLEEKPGAQLEAKPVPELGEKPDPGIGEKPEPGLGEKPGQKPEKKLGEKQE